MRLRGQTWLNKVAKAKTLILQTLSMKGECFCSFHLRLYVMLPLAGSGVCSLLKHDLPTTTRARSLHTHAMTIQGQLSCKEPAAQLHPLWPFITALFYPVYTQRSQQRAPGGRKLMEFKKNHSLSFNESPQHQIESAPTDCNLMPPADTDMQNCVIRTGWQIHARKSMTSAFKIRPGQKPSAAQSVSCTAAFDIPSRL